MKKLFLSILIIILISHPLSAQNEKSSLNSAIKNYKKGKFSVAEKQILKLFENQAIELNRYASIELYLLARIAYDTNRDLELLKRSVTFMDYFEFSRYTEHILYLKANSFLRLQNYQAALITAVEALNYATADLEDTIKKLARDIAIDFMAIEDIYASTSFCVKEEKYIFSQLVAAEKILQNSEKKEAEKILQDIRLKVRSRYDSEYFNELVKQFRDVEDKEKSISIGVVLPLSGDLAESGYSLLQGLKFAVEVHKEHSDLEINLYVRDNRGELIESVKAAEYLADISNVAAIIGPLTSKNAVAMAGVCETNKIPLLTPTATIANLNELGNTVFQFNTNQEDRSAALAEFAIDSLGLKTFATLAPSDDYGSAATRGFIREVEEKGGEVVYMGWYSGEPKDLAIQYKEMRDIAFNILENDTLDTNNVLLDSTLVLKTASDTLKIRLSTIDALYLPVYNEHIKFVVPQMVWWNFDLQLLGDGSFYDLDLMNNYRTYVNESIFSNNYYIDEEDEEYLMLAELFFEKTGNDFNMLNIYGYEMISFLLNSSDQKVFNRANLMQTLSKVQAYRGLVRNIDFDLRNSRTNKGIRIISYKNKQFNKLN
ncbi:MAG: penicillin-binding protein activator [Candidatus Marinimicrobia bacterium]|nr:penicillin-binding protein activator [Candidatus Neomarinimicrobiota bacterium]